MIGPTGSELLGLAQLDAKRASARTAWTSQQLQAQQNFRGSDGGANRKRG